MKELSISLSNNMEKIRLQKYISECGLMSRRAAEVEIGAGKVTINGLPAVIGDKVDPENDIVLYNGKQIKLEESGDNSRYTYILLNKPSGFVTTMSDEQGRRTIAELISNVGTRLYPVGRLDMFSDGLILCTNDGELANRIMHPSHNIDKKYIGIITTVLDDDAIRDLAVPFELDGYMLRPFEVKRIGYRRSDNKVFTVTEFTLHEGRNREIRNICKHHGYKLARLTRISIGKLEIGGIESGKWRFLTDDEIQYLKTI